MKRVSEQFWKLSFMFLLSLVFSIFVGFYAYVFYYLPASYTSNEDVSAFDFGVLEIENLQNEKKISEFTLTSSKKDLNQLIQHLLQKEKSKHNHLNYQINLKDQVWIEGNANIWGYDIPFEMGFDPEVLKNGDLLLHSKSIQMGEIDLPVDLLLKIIKFKSSLPKWVNINEEKKEIHVALTNVQVKDQFSIRITKFDLQQEEFEFKLVYLHP